jgi:hypothetical protein
MRPTTVVGLVLATLFAGSPALGQTSAAALKSAGDFSTIADASERSNALFAEMGKVIESPRCQNCHPVGRRPTQGDDMHPHLPLVVRGTDDQGALAMRCAACHHGANFQPAGVPGAPKWHVAPVEMAWQGKSLGQVCEQIKDPARNGGKSMEELIHHMSEDSLVGWGWHPGVGREPAPGTQKEFGALIKAWSDTGAVCPAT